MYNRITELYTRVIFERGKVTRLLIMARYGCLAIKQDPLKDRRNACFVFVSNSSTGYLRIVARISRSTIFYQPSENDNNNFTWCVTTRVTTLGSFARTERSVTCRNDERNVNANGVY